MDARARDELLQEVSSDESAGSLQSSDLRYVLTGNSKEVLERLDVKYT